MSPRLLALLLAATLVACGSPRDRSTSAQAAAGEAMIEEQNGGGGGGGSARMSGANLSVYDTMTRAAVGPKGEGVLRMRGGRTWFKVTGEGKSGTPVILIHDGPGGSSFAMKSLEGLGDERAVVRYDQIGGGRSDAASSGGLFTFSHYVMELDSLRLKLGYPRVHLIGHSWGAVVALEYYKAHPNAVASLTLESPEIDFPALQASVKRRIKQLPAEQRDLLEMTRGIGTTARPDYQTALLAFIQKNVCCRKYVAADMDSTGRSQNDSAYSLLRGSNEITIDGVLAGYSAAAMLKSIGVPVLFTVGENDVADPATVQRFASMTPNGRAVVIKGIMHFPMWEAPEENLRIVRDFLHQADASGHR